MGMRFDGIICNSCNTLIEGSGFFQCNNCGNIVHRNAHCQDIHRMRCIRSPNKVSLFPDFTIGPDSKDIFK